MIDSREEFRRCLLKLDPEHPGFPRYCDELLESVSPEVAGRAYNEIFEFFRLHPESDMGAPGSLVHFVEDYFPNYVPALKHDARVYPSYNLILMINRILNSDISQDERADLMEILKETRDNASLPESVRVLSGDFLNFQNDKAGSSE